jgi:hypothetical protein
VFQVDADQLGQQRQAEFGRPFVELSGIPRAVASLPLLLEVVGHPGVVSHCLPKT